MRIGGHETFYLRSNWLTKGLDYLKNNPSCHFSSPNVATEMGVGRNMAKSIGWWLKVSKLSNYSAQQKGFFLTDFGKCIIKHDPYLTQLGTWWLLHAAIVTNPSTIFHWLFSIDRSHRFNRKKLVVKLIETLKEIKGKDPTVKSVQREVAVALNSYASVIPKEQADPEDNLISPLRRLNLLYVYSATGVYQRNHPHSATPEALGICLNKFSRHLHTTKPKSNHNLGGYQLCRVAFALGCDTLSALNLAAEAQEKIGSDFFRLEVLNGQQTVGYKQMVLAGWAELFFDRIKQLDRTEHEVG